MAAIHFTVSNVEYSEKTTCISFHVHQTKSMRLKNIIVKYFFPNISEVPEEVCQWGSIPNASHAFYVSVCGKHIDEVYFISIMTPLVALSN